VARGGWIRRGEKKACLVNLEDGRILWLSADGNRWDGIFAALAFSSDGEQLAAARHGIGADAHGCWLWHGLKGIWQEKREEVGGGQWITPKGTRNPIDLITLAFSPDGKRLALGRKAGDGRPSAYLVDVPAVGGRPEPLLPLGADSTVTGIAWSPDGQQVAT